MIPRRVAPDPLVEYFLDSALDAGELDACSAMTLRLYGDDATILPVIDGPPSHYRVRRQKSLRLAEMADAILPNLPPRRRGGLVRKGLAHATHQIVELAETFSNWAIDDEVDGGAMLPFRDQPRARNGVPFKRTMMRLRSPKFVRRYVKHEGPEHADHLKALATLAMRRAAACGRIEHDDSITADWRMQINFRNRQDERDGWKTLRANRKIILRSLRTAISVVGEEAVRAFLRGEEVKLVGREAILVLRKRGELTDRGHGCLSVGLASRDGTRLADLCTFIENTPTLDQLAGFALWMNAGEERAILEKANVIEATDAGRAHVLLQFRPTPEQDRTWALAELVGPERAAEIADILSNRKPRRRQLSYEDQRARNDAYWKETQGEWIEAMMVFVIGYRNFHFFKSAGVL